MVFNYLYVMGYSTNMHLFKDNDGNTKEKVYVKNSLR